MTRELRKSSLNSLATGVSTVGIKIAIGAEVAAHG